MAFNYLNEALRKQIIDEIKQQENINRKQISIAQYEIMKDRILNQVKNYLLGFYSAETLEEMPIFGCINLAKRIIQEEAAIYDSCPDREFEGVSEDQEEKLEELYKELKVDTKMKIANQYYKLQQQAHLQVVMVDGKLKIRNNLAHQLDAVPSPNDPEQADAYILSGFDKNMYAPRTSTTDGINEVIADADDYKANTERLAWWSKEFNFITDKEGSIVSGEDVLNPLGVIPFVEISEEKDGEYWVRPGCALTDFTIQWNASLSDLAHIVRMQGFAQAWFKGAQDMIPEKIQIGPSFVIKLPINANNPVDTDFGFANPSPDLAGSIAFNESLLSAFLTSRGIDPTLVNTKGVSEKYSSGLERLLSMINMFAPAKADFDLFLKAEQDLFNIIKAYINTYSGTDMLKYDIGQIPDNASVKVKFTEPQMVLTEQDKLTQLKDKIELDIMSTVEAIMEDRDVSRDEAVQIANQIAIDKALTNQAMIGLVTQKVTTTNVTTEESEA